MNLRLVGITVEELEAALEFTGLYVKGDAIRAVPKYLQKERQRPTTLDMWEKIGDAQDRARELQDKIDKIEAALRGDE